MSLGRSKSSCGQTPKTTKQAEKEKLKCGVGIFREIGITDDKGTICFAISKATTRVYRGHR